MHLTQPSHKINRPNFLASSTIIVIITNMKTLHRASQKTIPVVYMRSQCYRKILELHEFIKICVRFRPQAVRNSGLYHDPCQRIVVHHDILLGHIHLSYCNIGASERYAPSPIPTWTLSGWVLKERRSKWISRSRLKLVKLGRALTRTRERCSMKVQFDSGKPVRI